MRLLGPLRADLAEWRLAVGRPADDALVFPAADGEPWTEPAYQSWRRRAFKRALTAAEVDEARPYDLRHSFASLLLHEGRSVIYFARQLGHDARLTLTKVRPRHRRTRRRPAARRGNRDPSGARSARGTPSVSQRDGRWAARSPVERKKPRGCRASREWS